MRETRERYTAQPRTTLWLVPEGELEIVAPASLSVPSFCVEVNPFYIGRSVITNAQYEAFDVSHERAPSSSGDDDPVTNVSFHDARGYCAWYSRVSGKRLRLPTEVEWEYACRGGTRTRTFFGDGLADADAYLWDRENSGGAAHPVESLKANPFGLYDMLGLVWEWTVSAYRADSIAPGDGGDDADAPGPRVARGGSFRSSRAELHCGVRRAFDPDTRLDDVGFRIVRSLRGGGS
jgi:formylglycine-generating enzyme required for sulfatase activity